MKRFLVCIALLISATLSQAQSIPKVKMAEVVKYFSKDNDTVYVVNFWATFCKPCVGEIPHFIRLVKQYEKQKVKLLLVSLDLPGYYPAKIAAFVKKFKFDTNIAWLSETNADIFCPMIDQKWSGAIPATIIINNKTGFRKFFEDEINASDFEDLLQHAIRGSNTIGKAKDHSVEFASEPQ